MVTQKIIKEIYRKYGKPPRDIASLEIPRYLDILSEHHRLECEDGEIVNKNMEEFNPFARILIKRLTAVLNFDSVVAFVFEKHILFFDKHSPNMHVHFKPEKKGFFSRLFGK